MDCVFSLEIFWCNPGVLVLCPSVVFTAAPETDHQLQTEPWRTGGPTQTAEHTRHNRCSLILSLQFTLTFPVEPPWSSPLHLTFCHCNLLLTHFFFFLFCTIHPLTLMKGGGPANCPAHGNFPTRQAVQHKEWTQISWMWQSSGDCSLYTAASSHPTGDLFP